MHNSESYLTPSDLIYTRDIPRNIQNIIKSIINRKNFERKRYVVWC